MAQPGNASVAIGLLAGGASRRFGGQDKGMVHFQGRPLIEWTLKAAQAFPAGEILISANRNLEQYQRYGYPVFPDRAMERFPGPLAGMARLLAEARTSWVLFLPCDALLVPNDILSRMLAAANESSADIAVLADGEQLHPTFSLVNTLLADQAAAALVAGERSPRFWFEKFRTVRCQGAAPVNINTPDALSALKLQL